MRYWMLVAVLCLAAFVGSSFGMSVAPTTFSDLVARAAEIRRVKVLQVQSRWDDGPQGPLIHTYISLQILGTLKGGQSAQMTLRILGGQVDDTRLEIPDMPTFEVGRSYILFIGRNGVEACPLIAAKFGMYPLVNDPVTGAEHVQRGNGSPLPGTGSVVEALPDNDRAPTAAPRGLGMHRTDFEAAITHEMEHPHAR